MLPDMASSPSQHSCHCKGTQFCTTTTGDHLTLLDLPISAEQDKRSLLHSNTVLVIPEMHHKNKEVARGGRPPPPPKKKRESSARQQLATQNRQNCDRLLKCGLQKQHTKHKCFGPHTHHPPQRGFRRMFPGRKKKLSTWDLNKRPYNSHLHFRRQKQALLQIFAKKGEHIQLITSKPWLAIWPKFQGHMCPLCTLRSFLTSCLAETIIHFQTRTGTKMLSQFPIMLCTNQQVRKGTWAKGQGQEGKRFEAQAHAPNGRISAWMLHILFPASGEHHSIYFWDIWMSSPYLPSKFQPRLRQTLNIQLAFFSGHDSTFIYLEASLIKIRRTLPACCKHA